ncbi:putative type VI secretion system effector [Chromobacterium sp. Panama]|uniref:putative type VI secretion system effector n=1 Tax=Chromobacterium sp. Panama TaxID=2161826 RepID=UPI0011B25688|nr:putative type VI secretion system effector [Chromobacterium sp. Panama]
MSVINDLVALTPTMQLSKINGKISRYKKTREMANFFFTDRDRNIMGLSAIAGALAGAAGMAANTARDASNLREQADYIEMEINGLPAKGWVWFSPFKNGDEVELIGTFQGDYFEIIAIARPQDRTIALYPHCSRGKNAHITTIIKWWLIATTFLVAIFTPALLTIFEVIRGKEKILGFLGVEYFYASIFAYLLFGTYSLVTGRKFMMYVHAATQVFKALGLPDPDNIDLPKRTKRRPGDPGAFGVMYFNY